MMSIGADILDICWQCCHCQTVMLGRVKNRCPMRCSFSIMMASKGGLLDSLLTSNKTCIMMITSPSLGFIFGFIFVFNLLTWFYNNNFISSKTKKTKTSRKLIIFEI
jgi:hypothetical protein